MTDHQKSRLTQSFLGLSDEAFHAVPALEKALGKTLNSHLDAHHSTMGTVLVAFACVVGELLVLSADDVHGLKAQFSKVLDAYVSAGMEGARIGRDDEPSLVRRPWSG